MNAVNPFDEEIKSGNITAKPMEVLISLAESLVGISNILNNANQLSETHAALTAKAVDAINALAKMSGSGQVGSSDIFASLNKLARGD